MRDEWGNCVTRSNGSGQEKRRRLECRSLLKRRCRRCRSVLPVDATSWNTAELVILTWQQLTRKSPDGRAFPRWRTQYSRKSQYKESSPLIMWRSTNPVQTGTSTRNGQNPTSSALSAWLRRELVTSTIKLSVRWMGSHRNRTSSVGVFYEVHRLHHVLWKFNALLSYMNIKLIIW